MVSYPVIYIVDDGIVGVFLRGKNGYGRPDRLVPSVGRDLLAVKVSAPADMVVHRQAAGVQGSLGRDEPEIVVLQEIKVALDILEGVVPGGGSHLAALSHERIVLGCVFVGGNYL